MCVFLNEVSEKDIGSFTSLKSKLESVRLDEGFSPESFIEFTREFTRLLEDNSYNIFYPRSKRNLDPSKIAFVKMLAEEFINKVESNKRRAITPYVDIFSMEFDETLNSVTVSDEDLALFRQMRESDKARFVQDLLINRPYSDVITIASLIFGLR